MQTSPSAKPFFEDGLDHETPELVRGKSAILWCNVTGFPQPKIKWSTVSLLHVFTPCILNYYITSLYLLAWRRHRFEESKRSDTRWGTGAFHCKCDTDHSLPLYLYCHQWCRRSQTHNWSYYCLYVLVYTKLFLSPFVHKSIWRLKHSSET